MRVALFLSLLFSSNIILSQLYDSELLNEYGIDELYAPASCFVDINSDGYIDFWNGSKVFFNSKSGIFQASLKTHEFTGITKFADYNNDGFPDLLHLFDNTIHLLKNEGPPQYQFTNVDDEVNLGIRASNKQLLDISWVDINNDGLVDIYVSSYEFPPDNSALGQPDYLYIQEADHTFRDVSSASKIADVSFCSRGISVLDYNDDGFQDLYVSSYRLEQNVLWENQHDGSFINKAQEKSVAGTLVGKKHGHTIATAIADLDANGQMDIFAPITHHTNAPGDFYNHIWLNKQGPEFMFFDVSNLGLVRAEIGANPSILDINNDGEQDLFYVNLYGKPASRFFVYQNEGGVFSEVNQQLNLPTNQKVSFAHFFDFNKDGFLDILPLEQRGDNSQVFISKDTCSNNYISMVINGDVDAASNFSALGARVKIYYDGYQQTKELNNSNGNGYGSMFMPFIHFGVSSFSKIDSIEIRWPNLNIETHYNVDVNHHYRFVEGKVFEIIY